MTNIPNAITEDEMFRVIDELGAAKGAGEDSLASLAIAVAKWAKQGTIKRVDAPKKNATGEAAIDYMLRVFERFNTARGNRAFDKRSAGSLSAQVSKLRAFGKLGTRVDMNGELWLTNVRNLRNEIPEKDAKGAYAAQYDATMRLKARKPEEMDEAELIEVISKSPAAPDTPVKVYESLVKKFEKVLSDGIDNSVETQTIFDIANAKLTALKNAMEYQDALEKIQKFTSAGLPGIPAPVETPVAEIISKDERATPAETAIQENTKVKAKK
jgi:hypothetical protein